MSLEVSKEQFKGETIQIEKRPDRKNFACAVPPSHPDFDRSRFSNEELIELLQYENKEIQASFRKAEERVLVLERLLEQNGIPIPGRKKSFFSDSKARLPALEDDVPQRSARRRLGSVSAETSDQNTPIESQNRNSVASITSNGPIDVMAGVPISLGFKTELLAAVALENVNISESDANAQTKTVSGKVNTPELANKSFFSSNGISSADMSPVLDIEPAFTSIAALYVSPSLLQDELAASSSSPDILKRRSSLVSASIQHSISKQPSESSLMISNAFKSRIRHPGSHVDNSEISERQPYSNFQQSHLDVSEISTIGTRGSLRSSVTHFDSSRDSKYGLKAIPQTPQLHRNHDESNSSAMTPNLSYNDSATVSSSTYFESTIPISPIQKTPKNRHRDFFKIPNSLSFGSSESVATRSNPSSFQVLNTPAEDDDIPLFIKPEDFHTIRIQVVSTISVNAKKSDDPNCTFSINDKESGKEMWRIRKSYNQIVQFDYEIRPVVEFFGLPNLPEKALFNSSTPSKVDYRLRLLQDYFNTIFNMPHIPQIVLSRICKYISLDFVNPLDDFKSGARKEGFLIRRYKGLGTTWKVRWCQIDGPALEIYELPGGALIEQIKLVGSQIGRQSSDVIAEERGYRHAFLIIETSKNSKISNSQPKHFFCAESDLERDSWIESMVEFTDNDPLHNPEPQNARNEMNNDDSPGKLASIIYKSVLDDSVPFEDLKESSTPEQSRAREEKKMKKRSMFNFRSRTLSGELPKPENVQPVQVWAQQESMQTYLDQMDLHEQPAVRVFGQELEDVYKLSHHEFKGLSIPSICYRCFDFLDRKGAIHEEGIFRLSGSASAIRQLKQNFNVSLDIDLFETQLAPDVHTVAGLLKSYLRELPSPIFGAQVYTELQHLVTKNSGVLPNSQIALMFKDYMRSSASVNPINYDFCVVLFGFLRSVVAESSINRMSLKNVCIVFVPTLNVSVEILSLCLVDYDCIFGDADPTPDNNREVLDLQIPTF